MLRDEDVIATRELDLVDERGNQLRSVTVRIERPRPVDDDEWQCRYQIVGLFDDRVWGGAIGIDAVQAIQGAMTVVGGMLEGTDEWKGGGCAGSGARISASLGCLILRWRPARKAPARRRPSSCPSEPLALRWTRSASR